MPLPTQGKTNWKYIIIVLIFAFVIVAGVIGWINQQEDETAKCEFNEMIFYFHPACGWCNKVKEDKSIPKLEELGVKVTQINTTVGPIKHQFSGVPTFVINDKVYSGYRTFEQLKELLGC